MDKASQSYGGVAGVAYCAQKRPGLEWRLVPDRVFLDLLHFFGEACLPDIACYLVEEVLQLDS